MPLFPNVWQWIVIFLFFLLEWREKLQRQRRERIQEEEDHAQNSRKLAKLRDLQRTKDPMIAAQVYNRRYSALCRLPDELLLLILRCLGEDPVALCCLRRVSGTFRRLLNEPSFHVSPAFSRAFIGNEEIGWLLPVHQRGELRRRLQADGMCGSCKLWFDVPVKGWRNRCIQFYNLGDSYNDFCPCKFGEGSIRCFTPVHCGGCDLDHLSWAFSREDARLPTSRDAERRCLGRQGRVQLCEHVGIPWSAVEDYIAARQQHKPGDGRQGCLDGFLIEGHHRLHHSSCSIENTQTRPGARLRDNKAGSAVYLVMEWAPHSGVRAFSRTPDGCPVAAELRTLFQKYREPGQPAEVLTPRNPSGSLPEMACFDPGSCRCLRYETGTHNHQDSDFVGANDAPAQWPKFFSRDCRHPPHSHLRRQDQYLGANPNEAVWLSQHWPKGTRKRRNGPCLITTYERTVAVCDEVSQECGSTRPPPTHSWFHAMDPDTYPDPMYSGAPRCKAKSCMRYYKRHGAFYCIHDPPLYM